jgi:hypothetical protein
MLSVLQACLPVTENFKNAKENQTEQSTSKVISFMEINIYLSAKNMRKRNLD